MKKPPPPKNKPDKPSPKRDEPAKPPERTPAEELAEVERALSLLHDRHPEHARVERETRVALEARKAEIEAAAAKATEEARRARRKRIVLLLPLAAAIAAAVVYVMRWRSRLAELESAVAKAAAPYVAHGFARIPSPTFWEGTRLEADLPGDACFVALAPPDAVLDVERPAASLHGTGSIAFCTCAADHAGVASPSGVALVGAEARAVGGNLALPFLDPRPGLLAPAEECSPGQLDGWLEDGHGSTGAEEAPVNARTTVLLSAGLRVVATAAASLPFAVVEATKDSCFVATSGEDDDTLTLRIAAGDRPIDDVHGPIGWCASAPKRYTVWRAAGSKASLAAGSGSLEVRAASATRIGGSHGLREAAARAGVTVATRWVPTSDLAWDASCALRAGGVAAPEVVASMDGRPAAQARFVALSTGGAPWTADASKRDAVICEPKIGTPTRTAVCAETRALTWHPLANTGEGGVAQSPLPFWMQVYAATPDAEALPAELALFALGRRLSSEGFEPVILEGVTETDDGAEVTGRAGDDAIVAVTTLSEWPWTYPLSDDGTAWRIDGAPRVIPLDAGLKVRLRSATKPAGNAAVRRTVVFRRVTGGH